ncbi:DNA-methyltransferase [Halorientalis pallida]|uniref:Type II methyltransferase n=1 Tax=Halorientalis pallida TaxID=2479928 RepID=A0A498KX66_9EURY|nr:site-specific DNA-methyltransferase [Halorientalis pallida]RXK48493.1 site-specific DNA-methyltransferase [Halorientalis pallida]
METEHRVVLDDARTLAAVDDDAVDLVVTSPPYPLVEQWDDLFAELDPAIETALDDGDGDRAFQLMHDVLDTVWAELERVLAPGGLACINVGDATRTVDGQFQLWPNHTEIVSRMRDHGFTSLPEILWRKPTNSPSKFMGSGTLPPNAYPTLEHEHVLVFRNGDLREFPPGDDDRYESAYFWEERNEWFSDCWEILGEDQHLDGDGTRQRSAAYPLEIPLRLIRMFSTYGDTVLDPFLGTGTTTIAAMVAGRDSVGYELDPAFAEAIGESVERVPGLSERLASDRLDAHREFVERRRAEGDPPGYEAENYDFPVTTRNEREIQLYTVADVASERTDDGHRYLATHEPY